jgi:hypothetical protein
MPILRVGGIVGGEVQGGRKNRGDSLVDDSAFKVEQEKLGNLWTFLGITAHLKKDNDWFRAALGGRLDDRGGCPRACSDRSR